MAGIFGLLLSGASVAIVDQYFEYTTLLLPGNGTNGKNNNEFLDSSSNAFTITRNPTTGPNAPTQGTFSPFSQTGWGNYFVNTSSQYLSVANNTALQLSGDFTIELWAYLTASTGTNQVLVSKWSTSQGYLVYYDNVTQKINFQNTATSIASSGTFSLNTWKHIAVTRSGNNYTLYIDGSSAGTSTSATTVTDAGGAVNIGRNTDGGSNYTLGYISNLRIVKGVVVYTGAFTPPTSPLTATQSAGTNIAAITTGQTSLLTCQSNRFIDNGQGNTGNTGFTITPNGSPTVVAFSPFNPTASWSAATYGGSGYFDGSGDYLSADISNNIVPTTGDFTIESWVCPTGTALGQNIFYFRGNTSAYAACRLAYESQQVALLISTSSSSWAINSGNVGTIPLNAWTHIAITRSGGTFTLYINGTSIYTSTAVGSGTALMTGSLNYIGIISTGSPVGGFNGYISSTRVSNTARTGLTTVPTTPYSSDGNTNLLLNFTNAGIYDATSKNDLETVGNAQISTAISAKWGSGSINFNGTNSTLYQRTNPNLYLIGDFTVECWLYLTSLSTSSMILGSDNGVNSDYLLINSTSISAAISAPSSPNYPGWSATVSTGQWYHLAFVRQSGSLRLYFGGNVLTLNSGNASESRQFLQSNVGVFVGRYGNNSNPLWFNGYIQDFRITNGYCRYVTGTGGNAGKMVFNGTNDLALPTAAFPTL